MKIVNLTMAYNMNHLNFQFDAFPGFFQVYRLRWSAKGTLETIINGVFTPHSAGATSMGREKCSNFYKSFTNTVLYRFKSNPNVTCNTMPPMLLFWISMFYHYTCSLIELCQTFTILFSSTVWISWDFFFRIHFAYFG